MNATFRRARPLLVLLATLLLTAVAARRAAPAAPAMTATPEYALAHEMTGDFGRPRSTISDLARSRLYTAGIHQPRLNVIDTRPIPAATTVYLDQPVSLLGLNPEGTRLYMTEFSGDPRAILVYDTSTYSVIDTLTYDCPAQAAACDANAFGVGPDGRLYLSFYNQRALLVLDGQTGQRLHEMTYPDGAPESVLVHGAALYTATLSPDHSTATLRRYDLSGIVPALTAEEPLPEEAGYSWTPVLAAAPDGSFLIARWHSYQGQINLVRLDPLTLAVELAYPIHPRTSIADAFVAAESDEVVVITLTVWPNVHAYNAADGSLRRIGPRLEHETDEFGFAPLPGNALANLSEGRLLVFRPYDYVAAVPVVLSGFCGGLLFDDFSDPTSGWPIADRGTVAYYYSDNHYIGPHYAILHRVPDAWSGVTRGDTWQSFHSLTVKTTIAQGVGTTGLIFGLNDDWSHFYSFEIVPELDRWVLYFFMDGWRIWAMGEANGINPTGYYTQLGLKPTPAGTLELQIWGSTVFTFPEIPNGRIGLGGGSFYEGVGHVYDDFTIEPGPNCRPNTLSNRNAIEQSPLLPLPPRPPAP